MFKKAMLAGAVTVCLGLAGGEAHAFSFGPDELGFNLEADAGLVSNFKLEGMFATVGDALVDNVIVVDEITDWMFTLAPADLPPVADAVFDSTNTELGSASSRPFFYPDPPDGFIFDLTDPSNPLVNLSFQGSPLGRVTLLELPEGDILFYEESELDVVAGTFREGFPPINTVITQKTESQPVPEPFSAFAVLGFGAVVTGSRLKNKPSD